MKQHINVILLFLCILTTFGCKTDKTDIYLKYALYAAGKNRGQLERVLDYYSNDSLKYKAACFLIENMPGQPMFCITKRVHKVCMELYIMIFLTRISITDILS